MEATQLPLRDIHLPQEIGWWPPAMGWWLLAILLPLIVWLIHWTYKRITKKTAIKTAKKQLLQIKADTQLDNTQKLAQLSVLFRRVVISISNRNECAGLTGQQWLEFLDRPMKEKPFNRGIGQLLVDSVYSNASPSDQDISQLIALCETWLKAQVKHKQ